MAPASISLRDKTADGPHTRCRVPTDLTIDQWKDAGRELKRMEAAVQWWLGDWWAFGIDRGYGDRLALADESGRVEGHSVKSLDNYGWVSGRYEVSTRVESLTFRHHLVAAAGER